MPEKKSSYQRQNVSWSGSAEGEPTLAFTKAPVSETINGLTVWDAARPHGWRALVHPRRWWRGRPVTVRFRP